MRQGLDDEKWTEVSSIREPSYRLAGEAAETACGCRFSKPGPLGQHSCTWSSSPGLFQGTSFGSKLDRAGISIARVQCWIPHELSTTTTVLTISPVRGGDLCPFFRCEN